MYTALAVWSWKLEVRVEVWPLRDQGWIRRRRRLLVEVSSGACLHQSTTHPQYLERVYFQLRHQCLARKPILQYPSTEQQRRHVATRLLQTFFSSHPPLPHLPNPHPLHCSCCSSENIVSHGMSKHVWPSFYEPVEWQDPPLCKAHKTSQTASQCNTELVRQQTLKLAFCDLLKVF